MSARHATHAVDTGATLPRRRSCAGRWHAAFDYVYLGAAAAGAQAILALLLVPPRRFPVLKGDES